MQRIEKELELMEAEVFRIYLDENTGDDIDFSFMKPSFRHDLNNYLKMANINGITNINDIVEFNKKDLQNRAAFGQDILEMSSQEKTSLADLKKIIDNNKRTTRETIDNILQESDVIVSLGSALCCLYAVYML